MRSWRIGTAFGIGLYVHWTFLLLPAIVGWFNLQHDGYEAATLAVATIFALLGCVMLHELGHALMARVFGVGTRDITMYPIGGVARLERMPDRPVEELFIAVAGPLVNVVIAAGLLGGMLLTDTYARWAASPADMRYLAFGGKLLIQLFGMNVMLVLFNMLPAFPMDGGRVLRSLLAMWIDRVPATEVAVVVASGFAVLFMAFAWLNNQPIIGLIGVFVVFLGWQELAMLRRRRGVRRAAVTEDIPTVLPVGPRVTVHVWDPVRGVWVAPPDGVRAHA
ncbi:MAG TPA: M50 family metallopeptidase [Gemmataceae bacterium]|jgi:Zn-dependent protease|nr:M50 family metallopeptidase [Gemmataceae bacterium]